MGVGVGAALSAMDAAAQQQLLAMAGDKRQAADAARTFSAFAVAALGGREAAEDAEQEAALRMLAAAIAPRLKALELAAGKNENASGSAADRRRVAVFSAKVAQVALKAAVNGADKASAEMELMAIDLACCALCVAVAFERDARLADLVLDNLLYQVAKRYADIQQPGAQQSAARVLGCAHIRLWSFHAKLMGLDGDHGEKSQFTIDASSAHVGVEESPMRMEGIAKFPTPKNAHSAQYTKLLLGVANTCITVFFQTKQYKNVYVAADGSFQKWIRHLHKTSSPDVKLAATLGDRVFRVLWKCASAVEASSKEEISESMRYRILGLLYMSKCPSYQPPQIIQQIHRSGVQMERISKRSIQDYRSLREFYIQSAIILSNKHPESRHIHAPKTLEWDYLNWLEHFASVCENADAPVESAVLMESAVHYLWKMGDIGQLIARCLCCTIAGTLLGLASKVAANSAAFDYASCDERLKSLASKLFTELMNLASDKAKASRQWEKGARLFLKKTAVPCEVTLLVENPQAQSLISFITRCLKRGSSKLYNLATADSNAACSQLCSQIVTSFNHLGSLLRGISLGKSPDSKLIESVILTESRLQRLSVAISLRSITGKNDSDCNTRISKQVESFRKILDAAIVQNASPAVMQGVLADLNAIARESYACAARFYQANNFQGTISSLIGAFELGESYLEYVMCSDLTMEEIVSAHEQLKVDAVVTLLAYCFNEISDFRRARIFTGHSILYCTDANGVSQSTTDKYVSATLKEFEINPVPERSAGLLDEIQHFVDSITPAFRSRQVSEAQIVTMLQCFRQSFEQASDRIMLKLRSSSTPEDQANRVHLVESVRLSCECQNMLDRAVLKLLSDNEERNSLDASLTVAVAVTKRKICYCVYYSKQNADDLVQGLVDVCGLLAESIDTLQCLRRDAALGIAYGWRGVIRMEISLLRSYCSIPVADTMGEEKNAVGDDSSLSDFEKCVMCISETETSAQGLFDLDRSTRTLSAICDVLYLIPSPEVESAARSLLTRLLTKLNAEHSLAVVGPPPSAELGETFERDQYAMDVDVEFVKDASNPYKNSYLFFRALDECIANALRSKHDIKVIAKWVQQSAIILSSIKSTTAKSSIEIAKAASTRQMTLHMILAELFFMKGKIKSAIAESRAALAICWKLSKKFASHSSDEAGFHFTLPAEIADRGSDGREDGSALLYFRALEFSSWDILSGTKFALCRLASLYVQAGQSRRAASYFTDAMRLVGGLRLGLFDRDPFCRYAHLQLKAGRAEKAQAALRLMSDGMSFAFAVKDSWELTDRNARMFIQRQQVVELLQHGDLKQAEGDNDGAKDVYLQAMDILSALSGTDLSPVGTCLLKARCWRKMVRVQATITSQRGPQYLAELDNSLKELKVAMADCSNPLERVKCMLELGQSRIFYYGDAKLDSFAEALGILEVAFLDGEKFGIKHLSHRLRTALGSAYNIYLDRLGTLEVGNDDQLATFLAQASGFLLANCASIETLSEEPDFSDDCCSPEAYFSSRVQDLTKTSPKSTKDSPREQLHGYVKDIADQVKHLPSSWVVVSVNVGPSSELIISRIMADECHPITFQLPDVDWQQAVADLRDIVDQSRVTLSGHSAVEAAAWTAEQKRKWWDTRIQLDAQMGESIANLQTSLGFWRCLLVKGTATFASDHIQQCWSILSPEGSHLFHHTIGPRTLLCAIADAVAWLSEAEVTQGLHHIAECLGSTTSSSDIATIQGLLRRGSPSNTTEAAVGLSTVYGNEYQLLSSISSDSIHKMKVAELKELLAAMKMSTSGLKKDLIERLLAVQDEFKGSQTPSGEPTSIPNSLLGSTILILDRALQEFPWEGLDVLLSCSGVTRMPSLDLVVKNVQQLRLQSQGLKTTALPTKIRRRHVRYILNPSGDLKATQKQLGPVLERQVDVLGWEGIVGSAPDPPDFRRFLAESDLIIYCGHGSGEKYLHRDRIKSISPGCSAALLFGCSSGRLETEGVFGPDGAVLSYLEAGSPGVLAMLWDVTDKDIDQLSIKVLNEWLLVSSDQGESKSLASVVQASRRVCKLPFLNGHAAVCYGLPLYVASEES